MEDYVVFTISSHKKLAKDFAKFWACPLGKVDTTVFADGEVLIKCASDVRNKDVLVIESTEKNPGERALGLLMLVDSLNRCGARTITLIIPYLSFSRQEKEMNNEEPLTAEIFAKIIETGKYTHLLTFDLHNQNSASFFKKGITSIPTTQLFANYYRTYLKNAGISSKDVVIVSPDHGSNARADMLAYSLRGAKRATLKKTRTGKDEIEHIEISGDVENKTCIIIDDIISTGGTIISASKILKAKGAKSILVGATHGVFARGAVSKIKKAGIDDIAITNSIETSSHEGVTKIDLMPLLIENL